MGFFQCLTYLTFVWYEKEVFITKHCLKKKSQGYKSYNFSTTFCIKIWKTQGNKSINKILVNRSFSRICYFRQQGCFYHILILEGNFKEESKCLTNKSLRFVKKARFRQNLHQDCKRRRWIWREEIKSISKILTASIFSGIFCAAYFWRIFLKSFPSASILTQTFALLKTFCQQPRIQPEVLTADNPGRENNC